MVDERFFLMDCGEGTQIQLNRFGHNPSRIHHIFISHLHGDHVFGLFGLLSSLGMMGRKVPLHLYGPVHLEALIKQHLMFFGKIPYEIICHDPAEVADGYIFEDDKITVTPIPLEHRTITYGYLFKEKKKLLNLRKECIEEYGLGIADVVKIKQGQDFLNERGELIPNEHLTLPPFKQRSYAYISDTLFIPSLSDVLKGVDLLYHEATFSHQDEKLARDTLHSTPVQAATLASEAGVTKLLIGHFSSRYKDSSVLVDEAREVFSQTTGVSDGDLYSVPQSRLTKE